MRINKRFQKYVDEKNFWPRISGKGELIEFPLSQEDVNKLGNYLSGDLSPENLACDGEISPSKARARGKALGNVVKDLQAYAQKNGLKGPKIYY
jgi:hypothetical protein